MVRSSASLAKGVAVVVHEGRIRSLVAILDGSLHQLKIAHGLIGEIWIYFHLFGLLSIFTMLSNG